MFLVIVVIFVVAVGVDVGVDFWEKCGLLVGVCMCTCLLKPFVTHSFETVYCCI